MFSGFTQETADFLWGLSFNNERGWFMEHKEQYQRCLAAPMKLLAEETTELLRQEHPEQELTLRCTRIYRDARRLFGRGPYKESLWFSLLGDASPNTLFGFWFEIKAAEYTFGMGAFSSTAEQMAAFRRSIDSNPARFERLAADIAAMPEFRCYGEPYKRPYGEKSPLIDPWYNRKNVGVESVNDFGGVILTPELPRYLADEFGKLMPMYKYISQVFGTVKDKEEKAP